MASAAMTNNNVQIIEGVFPAPVPRLLAIASNDDWLIESDTTLPFCNVSMESVTPDCCMVSIDFGFIGCRVSQ